MQIVGVRLPLTSDMENNQKKVPPFWETFLYDNHIFAICSWAEKSSKRILGVTVCESRGEIYYFIAAVTNRPAPPGMFEYQIPAATWVIFPCRSPYPETIQGILKRFLTEWLPFSGYTYVDTA